MRSVWALVLVAALLAGCTHSPAGGSTGTLGAGDRMRVAGLVESDTLVPLANATVRVLEANLTVQTKGDGSFAFPPLPPRVYSVEARLAGYRTDQLIARPDTNAASLDFVLQRATSRAPRQDQFHYRGIMDCAYEALIIAAPCDGGQGIVGNQTQFTFLLARGWNTTVVDVIFDLAQNPGIEELRVTVRGQGQGDKLDSYQQYGRFHDKASFPIRLDPGRTYTDGTRPVDANVTKFVLDVYAQGRGYHEHCVPGTPAHPAECLLGVGAAVNLQFDLYATVFYGLPAPPGYTLRTH